MDHWFDDLTKELAHAKLSRRSMLQWGLKASLVAAGTALFGRSGLTQLVSAKTEGQRVEGCDVHREGRTLILNLSARSNFAGKTLTYDQTTRKISRKGNIEITRIIKVGSITLLQIEAIQRGNVTQIKINYGEAFQGIRQATFSTADGKALQGEIDGRRLLPFRIGSDTSSVKFADGSPPLQVKVSNETTATLKSIMERAKQVAANCSLRNAGLKAGPERTQLLSHHAGSSYPIAPPQGDPGHDSSPETSSGCLTCEGSCTAGGIACGVAAAVTCAATFGFGCAAAIAGCAIAEIACWEGCHATGAPCCPVSCGDVACCNKAETCLNPNIGVCCSKGLIGCANKHCCQPTDTCINATGVCCPAGLIVCNNVCCKSGEVCKDGVVCCPPAQVVCGGVCCEKGQVCKSGVCCPPAQVVCAGVCCGPNQVCVNNKKCCPQNQACGNVCCDELSKCADSSKNLCCSFSSPVCGGICCKQGEQCINGKCCPKPCGEICCGSGQACQNGKCISHICPLGQVTCVSQEGPAKTGQAICCPPNVQCCLGKCCKKGELCCSGPGTAFGCHDPQLCIA
jgi:hypothetical protein